MWEPTGNLKLCNCCQLTLLTTGIWFLSTWEIILSCGAHGPVPAISLFLFSLSTASTALVGNTLICGIVAAKINAFTIGVRMRIQHNIILIVSRALVIPFGIRS